MTSDNLPALLPELGRSDARKALEAAGLAE